MALLLAALFVVFGFSVDHISVFQDELASAGVASILVWLYALPILIRGRPLRLVPRPVRENPLPSAVHWWGFGCAMWGAYAWLLVTPGVAGLARTWLIPVGNALVLGSACYGCGRGAITPRARSSRPRRWLAQLLDASRAWRSSAPAAAPDLPAGDLDAGRPLGAGATLPHDPGTGSSHHRTHWDRRAPHRPRRRH